MTKEGAKHLSEVLKAYSEGKQIEHLRTDGVWDTICYDPTFSEGPMNYRIKPELKLRPYKNAEEFLKAQKEHGMYLISKKKGDITRLPVIVEPKKVFMFWEPKNLGITGYTYSDLLNYWLHQNGSPCGILEE